jgi:hypothetical protein
MSKVRRLNPDWLMPTRAGHDGAEQCRDDADDQGQPDGDVLPAGHDETAEGADDEADDERGDDAGDGHSSSP